jgi:hypothetical protein
VWGREDPLCPPIVMPSRFPGGATCAVIPGQGQGGKLGAFGFASEVYPSILRTSYVLGLACWCEGRRAEGGPAAISREMRISAVAVVLVGLKLFVQDRA